MSMIFDINGDARVPLFMRVASSIEKAVSDGRLLPGDDVPAIRDLADSLGISRATALKSIAYLQQRSVLVKAGQRIAVAGRKELDEPPAESQAKRIRPKRINKLPTATNEVFDPSGLRALREHLALLVIRGLGVGVRWQEIMIFSSRSVMLNMLSRLLLNPDDVVIHTPAADSLSRAVFWSYCNRVIDVAGAEFRELATPNTQLFYVFNDLTGGDELTSEALSTDSLRCGVLLHEQFVLQAHESMNTVDHFSERARTVFLFSAVDTGRLAVPCPFAVVPESLTAPANSLKAHLDRHWNMEQQADLYRRLVLHG